MLRHIRVAFLELVGNEKHARAESSGESFVENNENQSIAPTLSRVAYSLHHHEEWIVECTFTRFGHYQVIVTRSVAGTSEGNEKSQRAPKSEKNEDKWNEDEFVVQIDHCSCYFPLHIETAVGYALHHRSWPVLHRHKKEFFSVKWNLFNLDTL